MIGEQEGMIQAQESVLGRRTAKEIRDAERVRMRRGQILQAAEDVMQQNGFHDTSMQAVAARAGVSVGLIYQYFANKDELLEAVIIDIMEMIRDRVPIVLAETGDSPRARLAALFGSACRVVDSRRGGTLLTYRESKTLPPDALDRVMRLEVETMAPFVAAVEDGVRSGEFRPVDGALVASNLVMSAHAWVLKGWNLGRIMSLDEYISQQWELVELAIRA